MLKSTQSLRSILMYLAMFAGVSSQSLAQDADGWTDLLDEDLSSWVRWIGVPHVSVEGLPPGTYQSETIWNAMGTPLGFEDPLGVFTTMQEDGETLLHVSGEIYGVVATREMYSDYHLSLEVKWGNKQWAIPPFTADSPYDTGLLFHCQGEHGASKSIAWRACIEYNIMYGSIGTYVGLGGMMGQVRGDTETLIYDPTTTDYILYSPIARASSNEEKPLGEWNTLELYALGDDSVYVLNGVVILVVEDMIDKFKNPLTEGYIELQSEASEAFYRNIKIRPFAGLPSDIEAQLESRAAPVFD